MRPLTIVVGTRPECIKVSPLVRACKARGIPVTVVHTGQHPELWKGSGLVPDLFLPRVETPDGPTVSWGLVDWTGPILVQGDTSTAYQAAMYAKGMLIHLEAGVRSHDLANPYPEEGYRVEIDDRADLCLCATDENFANLKAEKWSKGWVTGNTGVDACLERQRPVALHDRHATVLVTLHRRESAGQPMYDIMEAIYIVARSRPDTTFHIPLHPNGLCRTAASQLPLAPRNLKFGPPLAYGTFLNKLAHCQAVLTDSGGVQEDACTLGIPCAVAREVTDRPESVASGHALVVGRTSSGVEEGLRRILDGLLRTDPSTVFGDGKAAERIADHLVSILA